MSSSTNTQPDGVSMILAVRDVAGTVANTIASWASSLGKLGRAWEMIVVDSGSKDETVAKAMAMCNRTPHVRFLASAMPGGFGSSVRSALAESRHPLIATASTDYPYTPADLGRMLEKIGRKEIIYDRELEVELVNGCRTGVPVPNGWKLFGRCVRWLSRIVLGLPLSGTPGWLGLGEHYRSWYTWIVYGNPFHDPNCAFKLIRRSLLDSFPIQSDGDFVQIELIAKTTFLTRLADEVLLTPKPVLPPKVEWSKSDRRRLFRSPVFRRTEVVAQVTKPGVPALQALRSL